MGTRNETNKKRCIYREKRIEKDSNGLRMNAKLFEQGLNNKPRSVEGDGVRGGNEIMRNFRYDPT